MIDFKSLTVKWRWNLLIASIVCVFVLAYQFNIKKTVSLMQSCNELKKSVLLSSLPAKMNILKRHNATESELQNEPIVSFITEYCNTKKIDIVELSQTNYETKDSFAIETNKLCVRGSYANVLDLVHSLETKQNAATVCSANWELKKDQVKNDYSLYATIYIKHLRYENEKL